MGAGACTCVLNSPSRGRASSSTASRRSSGGSSWSLAKAQGTLARCWGVKRGSRGRAASARRSKRGGWRSRAEANAQQRLATSCSRRKQTNRLKRLKRSAGCLWRDNNDKSGNALRETMHEIYIKFILIVDK
eukprot:scaffold96015_cov26-Prasinocladus_malaysianus.AAC.1